MSAQGSTNSVEGVPNTGMPIWPDFGHAAPGWARLPASPAFGLRQRVDLLPFVLYLLRHMASSGVVYRALAGRFRSRAPLRWGAGERWVSLCMALATSGCGGGTPLLHPAHPLPVSTVSFGAGLSGQFASDHLDATIDRGQAAAGASLSNAATARTYAAGVLTKAFVGPGISPWVSARVGVAENTEAGLTYTGRSLRLDARYVFPLGEEWALSVGLGATALLLAPDSSSPGPVIEENPGTQRAEFELDASGFGGDIPFLVGYQAVNGFVDLWAGARVGYERASGELLSRVDDVGAPRYDAKGDRLWGAALAGFSLGVPPLWLRFELATTFHKLSGELRSSDGAPAPEFGELDASGWSLAPSGAILGKF